MKFDLDTIGQGMEKGVNAVRKVTDPIEYGMSTLKNQLVNVMPHSQPKAPRQQITPQTPTQSSVPTAPVGGAYQNYLKKVKDLSQ